MRIFNNQRLVVFCMLLGNICFSFFTATVSDAVETVTLQLKWKHQFQFAGYYAAIEQGYYAEEGLDVILKEGEPGRVEIEEVSSGRANYGIGMSDVLVARIKGQPLVVLANIFQHSPAIILTIKESGFATPQDLFNRKISAPNNVKSAELQAMLINEGISLDKVTLLKPSWDINDLINGKTDAVAAYLTSQPYVLKKKNIPYNVLSPATYGIDFYGDNLFTTESEIKKHPRRVAAFRKASLKGWQYAMKNPEEIVELILSKYNKNNTYLNREYLLNEAVTIQKLILPEFVEIGHMNPGRWKHIAQTYANLGMIDESFSLDGLIYNPTPTGFDWSHWAVKLGMGAIILGFGATLFFMVFSRQLKGEIKRHKQTEKELRESEERFKVLYDHAPLPYQSLDANGCFVEVNQTWLDLMGYKRDDVIGKSFAEFLHPNWTDHFRENFPNFKAVGEILGIEFELRKKDGDYVWVMFDGKIRRNQVGIFIQTHCVFSDITEQKHLTQKLKEQELTIQKAQKMESIGNLAGGIAHEFNNMLAIIMGNNELIMEELPHGSLARESTEEIRVAGLRARDVVKQLLTFSRKDDALQKVMDFKVVVQESMKLIRSSTPANIKIEKNLSDDMCPVMGNETQISQILINLCNNAVDALPDKGGIITIELLRETIDEQKIMHLPQLVPGQYAKLIVSDNGVGMPPEILDRIFEPYFTTKKIGEGTGIGMAVVYGIVERHGGAIIADSKPGKGTSFTIFLPVHEGGFEQETDEQEILPVGDECILYVDDEPSIAILGKRLLEGLGYTAESTTDPDKALDMLRNDPNKFDLLITDMAMPNMTGDQLVVETFKIRQDMPTIICTGYSAKISKKEATDIGVHSYIMKPINKSELAKVVRTVLDKAKGSSLENN